MPVMFRELRVWGGLAEGQDSLPIKGGVLRFPATGAGKPPALPKEREVTEVPPQGGWCDGAGSQWSSTQLWRQAGAEALGSKKGRVW